MIPFTPGTRIFVSPYAYTVEQVRRSWRERLFSRPWRPWAKFKTVHTPAIYRLGRLLVVHPSLEARLRDAIREVPYG